MRPCRECQHEVSEQASAGPSYGAPFPAKDKWDGWVFEYKSGATFLGLLSTVNDLDGNYAILGHVR